MNVQQAERVDTWRWADADLRLLLLQFRGLKVTQQYKQTQKQLTALGPEGQAPLARVQMEMLGKVVNDFLAQLGAQLSSSPAAAGLAASGMTNADTDLEAEGRMVKSEPVEGVDGEMGASKGSGRGQGGSGGGAKGGELGELTTNQVKKKNGLQHKREQMKAGETCEVSLLIIQAGTTISMHCFHLLSLHGFVTVLVRSTRVTEDNVDVSAPFKRCL